MKLVIGGYAQGKLNYVFSKYPLQKYIVYHALPENIKFQKESVIINHFHLWVKQRILDGRCPEKEILSFLDNCEHCIIISDEVGNGIVPIDPLEREYRERLGNILIELAKRAEEVERVLCGIGQKIK